MQLNPEFRLANTPFTISTKSQKWKTSAEKSRIAVVSSFGIGGTNAHVIVPELLGGTVQRNLHKSMKPEHQFNKQSYWSNSRLETAKAVRGDYLQTRMKTN